MQTLPRSSTAPLDRRFAALLRRSPEFAPGDRLGVAVSGGADSVALLRLLLALRNEFGVTLHVLHFHHSLRGAEADADADFVAGLARTFHLEFILEQQDVAAAAEKNHWNLEDAARRLRYAFFESAAASGQVSRVAVAHTADDQAETVLAHLMRGTGPRGLAGIHPVSGHVFRPLLPFRRTELRQYLQSLAQPWREDLSNLDTRRTRARIRARLLPLLETEFSLGIVDHLCNLARLAREEESFWEAIVENCFRAWAHSTTDGLRIRIEDLLTPPVFSSQVAETQGQGLAAAGSLRPLTERLIRRLYEEVRGDRSSLTALHVEQIIGLAAESSSGRLLQLPRGVEVERSFADLYFRMGHGASSGASKDASKTGGQADAYQYVFGLPGRGETSVSIPEIGACFKLKVIDWPLPERETKSDGVVLDADLLRAPLVLRNWRPGDAYRPRGRRQSRKLKQLFLARRVPLRLRAGWPVLESAGRLVWARGFPPAEEFSVRRETRSGVLIEESRA